MKATVPRPIRLAHRLVVARQATTRFFNRLGAERRLRAAFDAAPHRRLHLGAGNTVFPGWINTDLYPSGKDVVFLDVTKPFGLPNDSIDLIHSEHLIEHIDRDSANLMLRECFRILTPGGRIRIATPSLDRLVAIVGVSPSSEAARYVADAQRWYARFFAGDRPATAGEIFNLAFYGWGHQHIYSFAELQGILANAGFESIQEFPAGESSTPAMRDLEARAREAGAEELNKYEALCVEAAKPAQTSGPSS